MCLVKSELCTKAFIRDNQGKDKVIVYKVLREFYDRYETLYRHKLVWLNSEVIPTPDDDYSPDNSVFYGGCIHVFLHRYDAYGVAEYVRHIDNNYNGYEYIAIVRCEARMEDLLAVGDDMSACFKKVRILGVVGRYRLSYS